MAGTPVRRARREALRLGGDAAEIAGEFGHQQQLADVPLLDRERTGAGVREDVELSAMVPRVTYGAALALEHVIAAIPTMNGRDLAYAMGTLVDKAHKLRDLAPEPTTGAADLEREAENVAALAAELRRRGD